MKHCFAILAAVLTVLSACQPSVSPQQTESVFANNTLTTLGTTYSAPPTGPIGEVKESFSFETDNANVIAITRSGDARRVGKYSSISFDGDSLVAKYTWSGKGYTTKGDLYNGDLSAELVAASQQLVKDDPGFANVEADWDQSAIYVADIGSKGERFDVFFPTPNDGVFHLVFRVNPGSTEVGWATEADVHKAS